MNLGDLTKNLGGGGGIGGLGNIGAIWTDLQEHDWNGLMQTIKNHQGQDDGNDDEALGQMHDAAGQARDEGHPFPSSPTELIGLLGSKMGR